MKKLLLIILVVNLLLINYAVPTYAEDSIQITLNGKSLVGDQPPVIQNDRVLVPMRLIFEAVGADVYWNDGDIIAVKNDIKIFMSIGSSYIYKYNVKDFNDYFINQENCEYIDYSVDIQTINDRAMIPIRVAEILGVKVDWSGESNTVILTCDESLISDKNQDKLFFDEYVNTYKNAFASISPGIYDDIPKPNSNLPVDIQKLTNEIYNLNNPENVYDKIVENFGEPTGNYGMTDYSIPYWKVSGGELDLETSEGVIFKNNIGCWNLMKTKPRLGDILDKYFYVQIPDEEMGVFGFGKMILKDDNTYLFAYINPLDFYASDKPFFIDNNMGSWKMKFENGYSVDTDINDVEDGTVVAKYTFTGKNNISVVFSVNKSFSGVEFVSDSANCSLNRHSIDNPFGPDNKKFNRGF